MATIKIWQTAVQYYVGDLVIDKNTLYSFGKSAQAFVAGTAYQTNTYVKIRVPSAGGTINGVVLSADKEVVIKVTGPTGSLRKDANALFTNPAPPDVTAVFTLITDGNNAGNIDTTVWQQLGAFAQQDAATLNNYTTNLAINSATGNNLLILNPEHFSATIFIRLKDRINTIQTNAVRDRLNAFIDFQKDGLVDRNTNTSKRQRVTPTAPFPIPGIIDIPVGKTRVFTYGKYNPRDRKGTASYTFKGVVLRQNQSNPNEYIVDPSSILLKTKEGKWIDKYMGIMISRFGAMG
tara:strand:+ start:76 stop:951 length:876 start_codon:yes stop_codon:yes gene_type:complete